MRTNMMTIKKYVAILHHAFKLNNYTLIAIRLRQHKITPIPTYSIIDNIATAMLLFQLHNMRNSCSYPSAIIQVWSSAICHITTKKSPIVVHLQHDSLPPYVDTCQTKEENNTKPSSDEMITEGNPAYFWSHKEYIFHVKKIGTCAKLI